MSSGLISRSPVTAGSGCTRRRAGGLTRHGGVAGGHWRSGRLLAAPGSGDRVSTQVSAGQRAFRSCGRPANDLGLRTIYPAIGP